MLAQVERLGRLVQQLLDLSRLEAGVVPLERSPFPVEPLLEHAVREQRLQQSRRRRRGQRRARRPHRRRRPRAGPSGRREPARERRAVHRRRGGTVEVRARRSPPGVTHRSARRGSRHPRRGARRGSSSASTGPTRPARRETAAPDSASPSPAGSSTCTAARSIPNIANPTAAAWWSPCPRTRATQQSDHERNECEARMQLTSIEEALRRIRRGEMVLVVDDEDRENEGDLTMAASWVTPEAVNFMLRWARGLVCMPCAPERLDELSLAPMVPPEQRGLRHRVHRLDRPRRGGQRHRRGRPRAHDPACRRPGRVAGGVQTTRPCVPAARPAGRHARAAGPHRGRRSTSPASRGCRRSR